MAKAGTQNAVALERSPSHLLHRALQHALDIYGEAAGAGAPTQRQFAVLSAVAAQDGPTQTDLVRATGIDRSTMAELVARLADKGLLKRERSSTDGRANTVKLTAKGRAALQRLQPRVAAADARILDLLPERSRTGFLSLLLAMSRAAEQEPVAAKPARKAAAAKTAKPKARKKRS